ncbi:MAG: biopolymer transporter ExbD [Bdellovibrionaceae bacterium]|nr:biopolymer transporter ExbD [Pseudobdellovibrionaceae bacterium]
MAQIESSSKSGRKINVELNLVPFIDLMSVLITFLLITAVWTQVSMIQIGSSLYGKRSETQPPTPPPLAELVLKVDVRQNGYVLTVGKEIISLPLKAGVFDDEALLSQLLRVKQIYPEKSDAIVSVEDKLPYEQLITTMDNLLQAGFSAISVATGDPN